MPTYAEKIASIAGVQAHWRLGEASGTTASDEESTYDGTYVNTPTLGQTGALTGDADDSVSFTGTSSECVNMGDVLDVDNDSTLTYTCWFKTSSSDNNMAMIGKSLGVSPWTGPLLEMHAGALRLAVGGTSAGNYILTQTVNTFNDGAWHFVVATIDGTTTAAGYKIYVDDVLENVTVESDTLTTSPQGTQNFSIGSRNADSFYYTGYLDEVAVFNSVVSTADATSLYDIGINGPPTALIIQDVDHSHSMDSVVLSIVSSTLLVIQDASHNHSVDNLSLSAVDPTPASTAPVQVQIMEEIGLRLAGITTANGYFTTANKIKRAQLTPFVSGDLPALNYWPGEDSIVSSGGGYEDRHLNVYIEYHTKNRDRPFSDVTAELANDIWTALWRHPVSPAVSDVVNPHLGGLVSGIVVNRYVPEIGEGQAPWCGVLVEIVVLYQLGPDDPVTLLT